jgi:hypothetical protein
MWVRRNRWRSSWQTLSSRLWWLQFSTLLCR